MSSTCQFTGLVIDYQRPIRTNQTNRATLQVLLNNSHAGRVASNGLEQPVIHGRNTLPYWLILKLIYQYGKPFLIKDMIHHHRTNQLNACSYYIRENDTHPTVSFLSSREMFFIHPKRHTQSHKTKLRNLFLFLFFIVTQNKNKHEYLQQSCPLHDDRGRIR